APVVAHLQFGVFRGPKECGCVLRIDEEMSGRGEVPASLEREAVDALVVKDFAIGFVAVDCDSSLSGLGGGSGAWAHDEFAAQRFRLGVVGGECGSKRHSAEYKVCERAPADWSFD